MLIVFNLRYLCAEDKESWIAAGFAELSAEAQDIKSKSSAIKVDPIHVTFPNRLWNHNEN